MVLTTREWPMTMLASGSHMSAGWTVTPGLLTHWMRAYARTRSLLAWLQLDATCGTPACAPTLELGIETSKVRSSKYATESALVSMKLMTGICLA